MSSAATDPRGSADAWLWLPIAGVALGQRFVLPGASIADVALGTFAAWSLLQLGLKARSHGLPRLPAWTKWLAALWVWAAVGGVANVLMETDPFSRLEFVKSFAKLSFYAVDVVLLSLALERASKSAPGRIALSAFAAAGLVAILFYLVMLVGIPLPYQLLWGHGPGSAFFSETGWFGHAGSGNGVWLRAQGLASEPSRLGYLQAMALGYLLLRSDTRTRPGLRLLLIVLSALLTLSLTAYALLLLLAGLALWSRRPWGPLAGRRPELRLPARRYWLAGAATLLLLCPLAPTFYRAVIVRAARSLSGAGDVSARLRVLGSWEITYRVLETNPVLGVGLGNYDVVALDQQAFLFQGHLVDASTQGWNTFAYILGTTGLPGLLLFLGMLRSALSKQRPLAILFGLGMFADGTVLGAAFWVFFALYARELPD